MAHFDDDDEEEVLPECVTNYMFVDESEEPTCFSVLPFIWEDGNSPQECKTQVFLHGVGDDGLQKIYKQVIAWKVEFQGFFPVVYVLSKDNIWIKLLKAKKSFEVVIRKVLITLQCLHFIKKDPEGSEKTLWDSVRRAFSNYEVKPSRLDLQDHVSVIREISQKDEQLGKSQLLLDLLDARKKVTARNEDLEDTKKSDFINDDGEEGDGEDNQNSEADEDEEDDGYDSVCCICDNGGEITICDGRCLRAFHAVKGDGRDSDCATLGLAKEVKEAPIFKCPNCLFEKHQCFVCGKLGSSADSSREVFPCINATCGHFYHPRCVAKLLYPDNEPAAKEEEKKIADGHAFACPYHKCLVCRGIENKEVLELQFAMCRRCPRSYHRKCMPRDIPFDDDSDDEDIIQRAWDGLLPNRILIYCLDHEIDDELGTPIRNHLIFPEDPKKKKMLPPPPKKINVAREKGTAGSKDQELRISSDNGSMKKSVPSSDRNRIVKPSATSKKLLGSSNGVGSIAKSETSTVLTTKAKTSTGSGKLLKKMPADAVTERVVGSIKNISTLPRKIDPEIIKRIETLVHRSSSSLLSLDEFIDRKEKISTHIFSGKHVDKTITLGKVKGSIEAVQTALKQVEEDGGKTENAKAVCEPRVLQQIMTWKNKLSIYLGPFVHGLLYTSFGRHFTKVEKLEEIVDRLHWYVQSGDMIVDFCCGSNDFSLIMRKKLEDTGKICYYRNVDIIPPKNDFAFLKRDWMKVRHNDLNNVPGHKMIIGLNPPFGTKASLANKFIDKALEFKPKLVILIVPKETQRLDEKKNVSYDLIWEDDKKLSGKAFYLPGSVDDNDKQVEDWNVDPPPLYLWSRSEFTGKHKEIAREHGHVFDNSSTDVGKRMTVTRQLTEKDDGSNRKDRNDPDRKETSRSPRHGNDVTPKPDTQVAARHTNDKKTAKRKAERRDATSARPEGQVSPSKKMKKLGDMSSNHADEELSDMSISPPRGPQKRKVNETHSTMAKDETVPVVSRKTPDYIVSKDETVPAVSRRTPDPRMPSLGRFDDSDILKDNPEKSPYLPSRDVLMSTSSFPSNADIGDPAYTRSTDMSRYSSSLYGQTYSSDYLQGQNSLGLAREGVTSNLRMYGQQDPREMPGSMYSLGGTSVLGQTSSYSTIDKYSATIDKYGSRINEVNTGYTLRTVADRPPSIYGTQTTGSYSQVPELRGFSHGPRYPPNEGSSAGWLDD